MESSDYAREWTTIRITYFSLITQKAIQASGNEFQDSSIINRSIEIYNYLKHFLIL